MIILARPPTWCWANWYRVRQYLKGSLWLLPLLGGVAGLALAAGDGWIERQVDLPPSWQFESDTASGLLTTIIAAMVGLFGFVVTISVLVVQMATGTLSPRFMRLWYRDRLQKLVLAIFVGTVAFSFRLLREMTAESVPDVGVVVAGGLFGASLILLLLYLDRFAHNLRPVGVAAMVGRMGIREAERTLQAARDARLTVARAASPPVPEGSGTAIAPQRRSGAIQAVNVEGLVRLAVRHDCLLSLTCTVGDFISAGTPIVEVCGTDSPPAGAIVSMIAFGNERSIEDDPAFALRIMVDIAIRALSPAVNDPTTAVQLLNHIESLLRRLIPHLTEQRYVVVRDLDDRPRLVVPVRSFEDYLLLAVTEIRRYGAGSIQVCRRLTAVLTDLSQRCPPDQRPRVDVELATLNRDIERLFPQLDERALAQVPDRQGIGTPHLRPEPAARPINPDDGGRQAP